MKWSSLFLPLLVAMPLAAEPVLVGKLPAKIVPEQLSVLSLSEAGTVTDIAPEGHLNKGDVIAVLNKDITAAEREEMEFQLARDRLAGRDELRQLLQKREKLLFYFNLSEGERKYAASELEEGVPPTRESLRDIDERIALVQRDLDTMEKRRRDKFEREHDKHTLRMPFNGRLQYNINLPEERDKPFELVGLVQTFATACDDSSYYVTVSISSSDLSLLPERKFSVSVDLPEGRKLVGSYAYRRVERNRNGGDVLIYFFRLPAEDAETAYGMLGSNTTASLFYEVDGTVERISKAKLAAHPEAGSCESWAELFEIACPGAVVVVVAERDIIIRHAEKPAGQQAAEPQG